MKMIGIRVSIIVGPWLCPKGTID